MFKFLPGTSVRAVALCMFASAAAAGTFPERPVRLLVPFAPGGPTDLIGRVLAQQLTERWQKTVVVDNRAGAGGTIAVETAVKAAPDGYTVLFGSTSTFAVNPALYGKQSHDAVRDLPVVAFVAYAPQLLVVRSGVPAASVAELVALAKKQPGKLTFASSGAGTTIHLAGELFKHAAGIDILHIPYKGGGPAVTAMLSGEVDMLFNNPGTLLPHIQTGRLRALAVAGPSRSAFLPALPTFAEAGLPQVESGSAFGLAVPAGTPAVRVAAIAAALAGIVARPDFRERLAGLGTEPLFMDGVRSAAYVQREYVKWSQIVKIANVKAE
jgi:tripartite-type tricarboxylate transporter receptor subunit TctC